MTRASWRRPRRADKMGLRISVVLVSGVALIALMFQSLSRQVASTSTTSAAFNGSKAIVQDVVGVGGAQFPMLAVVAFIAGVFGTALLIR